MLEIQEIRDNHLKLLERLKKRGRDFSPEIDQLLVLDAKKRSALQKMEQHKSQLNKISKEIGILFRAGKTKEANALKEHTGKLKKTIDRNKVIVDSTEDEMMKIFYTIPNVPHDLVPPGNSEEDNKVVEQFGTFPSLHDAAMTHWELAEKYKLIDFETGVKITGAGFPLFVGKGARLQRGLINFFIDENVKAGYTEMMPPLLVNEASGIGTGQLPDKEAQMYHAELDNLYLIPTAEVPLTNIYRNALLKQEELPQRITGHTPCFRREAGSYGKDVRGLNRLHQFEKVEIVEIVEPATSYRVLDNMVEHVKGILEKLELPFRLLRLCGGDLGFASALTFDLEVYSAAQEKWLEVSSISNFETYQANRLKLRFKKKEGKNELVHTLNGSALALPRILAALLENNQDEKGIKIPKVLVPYTGFDRID
jgi:seryl-tRNA synthetase